MMFTENTHKMMTRSKSAERLALVAERLVAATAGTAAPKKPLIDPSYNMMVAYLLTVGLTLSTLLVTHSCGVALFMEAYCVFNIIFNYNDIKNYNGAPMIALEPNHWIRLYKVLHAKYNYLAIPGGDRILESEGIDLDEDLEPEGDDLEPEEDDLEPEEDDLDDDLDDDLEPEGDDLDEDLDDDLDDDLDEDLDDDLDDDLDEDLDDDLDDSDYDPDEDDLDPDEDDLDPDEDEDLDPDEDEDLDPDEDEDLDPDEDEDLDPDEDDDNASLEDTRLDIKLICITCDATLITKPNAIFVSLCGEHYCSACFPTVYENMNKTYIDEYYTTINPTGNDGWWDSSSIFHVGFWIDYQFTPDMNDQRNVEYYKQFSNTIDAIPLAIRMTPDPVSNESLIEDDQGLEDDDYDDDLDDDYDEDLDDDYDEDLDDDYDDDLDDDDHGLDDDANLDDDDQGLDNDPSLDDDDQGLDNDANDWEHCSQ